jgi:hypothetical protein
MTYFVIVFIVLAFALMVVMTFAMLKTASEYDDVSEKIYQLHVCMDPADTRVYNYLCEYTDWWPGYKQISIVLGMKEKNVRESCQRLQSSGHLEYRKTRNKNGTLSGSGYFVVKK